MADQDAGTKLSPSSEAVVRCRELLDMRYSGLLTPISGACASCLTVTLVGQWFAFTLVGSASQGFDLHGSSSPGSLRAYVARTRQAHKLFWTYRRSCALTRVTVHVSRWACSSVTARGETSTRQNAASGAPSA